MGVLLTRKKGKIINLRICIHALKPHYSYTAMFSPTLIKKVAKKVDKNIKSVINVKVITNNS